MKTKLLGGCMCGAVRYEAVGDPTNSSYCHCDDCKKATGGPYTVGVKVQTSDLCVEGEVKGHTLVADSGRSITREFCPICGSPLFTRAEKCSDLVFVKAGSLDEPACVKPSMQIWIRCAVPWAYVDEALPTYDESSEGEAV